MAYAEQLAARIRTLLANRTDVTERKMFGGLTFMVGGHMCCGVNGNELIIRLDPEREGTRRRHARRSAAGARPQAASSCPAEARVRLARRSRPRPFERCDRMCFATLRPSLAAPMISIEAKESRKGSPAK